MQNHQHRPCCDAKVSLFDSIPLYMNLTFRSVDANYDLKALDVSSTWLRGSSVLPRLA